MNKTSISILSQTVALSPETAGLFNLLHLLYTYWKAIIDWPGW